VKALTEDEKVRAKNPLWKDVVHYRQRFEIEQSDVGSTRDDYLAPKRPPKEFTQQDVGRQIEVLTAGGRTCWSFCPPSR
jgi:hypothetical protein